MSGLDLACQVINLVATVVGAVGLMEHPVFGENLVDGGSSASGIVLTDTQMMPRYLNHQEARLTARAYERTRGVIKGHLQSTFGTTKLADIRRTDIQKYVTQRSAEVSAGTVTKELNVMKHLLGLAVEWELIPLNPARGVKAPKVPAGRVRYLHPGGLRALLEGCPDWLRPIAALLVATGMRRGEVLGLRWVDVDRKGGRILLPQSKNGDGRVVYLNRLA